MADVKFEVVRYAMSTAASGSTQDITIAGFGTPKAAMFIYGAGNVDDTLFARGRHGIGFTDGTNQNAVDVRVEDAKATSVTMRGQRTDCCIQMTKSTTANEARFSFNSWITDGIRLDIDVAAFQAGYVTCILIGGADVSNVHVGHHDDLGTGTSPVDINTIGFEPDLVFLTCTGNSAAPPDEGSAAMFSFGVGHNDGLDSERSTKIGSGNSRAAALATSTINNNNIAGQVYADANTWNASIGSYDASGFSLTPTSSTSSDIVFYLCLKFTGSPDIALFDMEFPTSGNYAETTPGFAPTFGMISSLSNATARNTLKTTTNFALGLTAFDDSTLSTQMITDEDAADPTVSKSLSSSYLRLVDESSVTDYVEASGYALDADGWDFTLITNPPTNPVLGWALAIGNGAGAVAIAFTGTVPTQNLTKNVAMTSLDLSTYFSGTATPFAYTVQTGTLPAGLSLDSSTGVISGTATADANVNIVVRGTDNNSATADTNLFNIIVTTPTGTVTMTDELRNNTGTILSNETGVAISVLDATTLESVFEDTSLTTNGSGVMSAIVGASITAGTDYYVVIKLSDASVGIAGPFTAT